MLQVEGLCALVSGCEELVAKAQQHGTVIQVGCLAQEPASHQPTDLHSPVWLTICANALCFVCMCQCDMLKHQ